MLWWQCAIIQHSLEHSDNTIIFLNSIIFNADIFHSNVLDQDLINQCGQQCPHWYPADLEKWSMWNATLTLTTNPTIPEGKTYDMTLWIRAALAGSRCTASIVIDNEVIAVSPNNVAPDWSPLSGTYSAPPELNDIKLALVVSCPASISGPIRRQENPGEGLDLDDLTMDETDPDASPSETATPPTPSAEITSTTSQSAFSPSAEITPTSIDTDVPPTPSAEITSTSSASGSTSVVTPSTCSPILIDSGFEVSGPAASSDPTFKSPDWSSLNDFDGNVNDHIWANLRYEGAAAFDGRFGYTVYTDIETAATYDIKYLHPVSLCAGTAYHVSTWVRTNRRNSAWTEGCRVSAFLNDKVVYSDRVGWYDWIYRYLDGTITVETDTSDAEFFIRVECRPAQVDNAQRWRGVK